MTATTCRSCDAEGLVPVLSLGETPLADGLLTLEQLSEPELKAPLELTFCPRCTLAQITETVDPEILFCRDYPYYSSVSSQLMEHFRSSARRLISTRHLGPHSMVVEAASNDGYMLSTFADAGIPVLGVDPASGPAQVASDRGIPTLNTFFNLELARELRDGLGVRADVFLANNVLAHVPDLNGFVAAIKVLLKREGVAVIEVPYVADLVAKCEFDTIYHQHLCYFSVRALDELFKRHGLFLNDVERLAIHGGSLRLFVEQHDDRRQRVDALIAQEFASKMDQRSFYADFAQRVSAIRDELGTLLRSLRARGERIAAYGAAAKATTLCSYVGIGTDLIDYVVDRNAHKEGRYMGGNHLPIVAARRLREDPPDYLLLLAWNFADEIMQQEAAFREQGGRFIIPIPEVQIV
ncbi:NDP-hexose 3-C-methyltransferase [Vulcanimicrobium alpinum]|uniref:NDP-hexose 3-C-methyltransferase n=1 Tax=Vulcanimicrobium alpinum TaxID=3016050 RepID=A0AAN1XXM2_UNVUL|nr:class I SAM-dependent methyltransferase [Vulcanimicrobium alpinum]BDE07276.1 NDP-hexose 3-C-methyltransferase [Vulcanimicrobium alpinum]